ncbi:hypothetical protein LF887_01375 [Chryseobacterium sp. MEBOG06]|uniref:hypothetical protein n=1 Tax=unclassified Chryseobacterium TaxID=2593645 RepID=UPI001F2AFC1A|nr:MULTISPECIES: hypothetical protein [unclassified Chryseobacterium]UKB84333.1 hypothetical protein LF887_01375 [Chryseobacterium sp. MEBOG06]
MKVKDEIFCNSVGVYSNQLTKRKSYVIQKINDENIRVFNDENKLKWYSKYYFSLNKEPEILSIHIDDKIDNAESDEIEVTIEFTDKEKYWLTFTTPKYVDEILDNDYYFSASHFIIIKNLSEESIKSTIKKLDDQNKLIEHCQKY